MKQIALIKCHGGKFYLGKWIISRFPKNYEQSTYVEPYAGGCNVFLQKKSSINEVLNDLHYEIYCVIKQVKDNSKILLSHLAAQFYSQNIFDYWLTLCPTDERIVAQKEIILRRFSRGGLKKTFAWSKRLRGGEPGDLHAWKNFIKNFPTIANRFQQTNLTIHNENAIICMERYDGSNTVIYCDPPYLHETRKSRSAYDLEMTDKQHEELLNWCLQAKSKILISGYDSRLYNNKLKLWNKFEKSIANHSGQNKIKQDRREILWRNF